MEVGIPADSLLGWLPAVLPASARSFRVGDPSIAATLADAGAELTTDRPDVEIADVAELAGDAHGAIVSISAAQPEGGPLIMRAPRRVLGCAQAAGRARATAAAVRRSGYSTTTIVPWDIDHLIFVPGVSDSRRGKPLAEWLPERALVLGARGEREQTALEVVAQEAGAAIGGPLRYGWPLARASAIVVIADRGVINAAVGPGRQKIKLQQAALSALEDAPHVVRSRLPRILASGRTGLVDWALETRLSGTAPGNDLSPQMLAEVLDFLVALHEVGGPAFARESIRADAHTLASVCVDPENADRVRRLGEALERNLAGVPRGFAHGDFWTRNLLRADGSLTGVIDWDGAGPGRLPLLDLLHLILSAHRERTRQYFGQALVDHLLPAARRGGSEVVRTYAGRIGLALDPELLEALVLAYWLDRIALEIAGFSDRARRPVWIRHNVDDVLRSLEDHALIPA